MVVVVFLNIQINERVKFLIINFISTFLYKISFRNQHACVQLYNMMDPLNISPNNRRVLYISEILMHTRTLRTNPRRQFFKLILVT